MNDKTRIAGSGRFLTALFTAAALCMPLAAGGAADWDDTQDLEINADSFTQVLFYDYETSDVNLGSVGFGDRDVTYNVRDGEFVGAFLYDYFETRFTTGFYATTQSF